MLLAGRIGKPHGLAGEVYVERISDDPRRFEPGSRLIHEDGRELVVAKSRPHRSRFLVLFAGCASREDAEALRGSIYVPDDQVRDLAQDEYWPDDLVGCAAADTRGNHLGAVTGVVTGPAQDLLQLDTDHGQRLVPLVKEIVVSVDIAARALILDPPEGLLD